MARIEVGGGACLFGVGAEGILAGRDSFLTASSDDGFQRAMAQCDQGYLCEVCGDPVELIEGSDLYLRYILGEVEARALLSTPERHLRCNPVVTQFIVDPAFEPIAIDGPFNKAEMDHDSVTARESLVTRAWRRLQEVRQLGLPISEYPLPEVLERRAQRLADSRSHE